MFAPISKANRIDTQTERGIMCLKFQEISREMWIVCFMNFILDNKYSLAIYNDPVQRSYASFSPSTFPSKSHLSNAPIFPFGDLNFRFLLIIAAPTLAPGSLEAPLQPTISRPKISKHFSKLSKKLKNFCTLFV